MLGTSSDTPYQAFADGSSLTAWLPPSGMSGRVLDDGVREAGRDRTELRYDDKKPDGSGKTTDRRDITNGQFLELLLGRRIKQSVELESSDPAFAEEMTMTWLFDTAPAGTRVTLTAANVPSGISKADHEAGLTSSLENLATFVERR